MYFLSSRVLCRSAVSRGVPGGYMHRARVTIIRFVATLSSDAPAAVRASRKTVS